ncbi:hypothetical protein DMX03_06020 [Pseudomonas koreensis]|jgi:hypothetical protein|uniref:hypothetical protein n=1 Tax=Pseudomonas moraviensis TaxID=321662 RepID=UPI00093744DC|nr:hypothetical protein [Pseudomonas moraviensis]OJT50909.1 hypothetical protein BSZ28_13740 [Pseudomonas moraviensis]PYB89963.1 hypothetical protein DMX03_06020 [Pseudomonas koreensis]
MSSHQDVIAQLIGVFKFNVDPSGLQRFIAMMRSAERQMTQLGKQADALQKKLSAKMGVKVDSAGQEKLAKTVRASLGRELKLGQAVQRTGRVTFIAELLGKN